VCKKSIENSQPFVNKMKNVRTPQGGGGFFGLTLYICTPHNKSTLYLGLYLLVYLFSVHTLSPILYSLFGPLMFRLLLSGV